MNGCRNRQLMIVMVGVDGRSLLFAFHFQGNKRSKVMKLSSFLVHLLSRTDDFHIARSSGHFLFETLSSLDFDHSLLVFLPTYCLSSVFFAQCFSVFLTCRVGLKIWTAFFSVVIPQGVLFRSTTLNTRCMMMTPKYVFLFLTFHWSLDLSS